MNSEKVNLPVDFERRFRGLIRPFPDFPTPGILFQSVMSDFFFADKQFKINSPIHQFFLHRDIMPVLKEPAFVKEICCTIADFCKHSKEPIHAIAGLEARGFFFAPLVAVQLNIPFIAIRKKGKLPGETISASYQKEYGPVFFDN